MQNSIFALVDNILTFLKYISLSWFLISLQGWSVSYRSDWTRLSDIIVIKNDIIDIKSPIRARHVPIEFLLLLITPLNLYNNINPELKNIINENITNIIIKMKEAVSKWLHFTNIIFKREKINVHVDKINIEHSMHLDENELQQLQQQQKHKHIFLILFFFL